VVVG
jgi:hypothetical protein